MGNEVAELISEAEGLDYGEAKVALLDEAVRLADRRKDLDLQFEARMAYSTACAFSGYPQQLLVAFAWCLGQMDRHPDRFFEFEVLWQYKWIPQRLARHPDISLEQIESTMQDLEKRYRDGNASMRTVHFGRFRLARYLGDVELAKREYDLWRQGQRDHLSDCFECELDGEVALLFLLGEDEKGLKKARILFAGRRSCVEVPHITYGRVLMPLVRAQEEKEAREHHIRGYRMIRRSRELASYVHLHITYLVETGDLSRALAIFERHWPTVRTVRDPFNVLDYYIAALPLMKRLQTPRRKSVKIRLPEGVSLERKDERVALTDLEAWMEKEVRELAARFDKRNGNSYHSDRVDQAASTGGTL